MTKPSRSAAPLTIERYEQLLNRAPANDVGPSTDPLVDELTLVRQLAGALVRRLPPHIELDELIALGNLGLVEARRRFDASRGVPFAAFAALRIRGAMLDGLRAEDLISRDERSRVRRDEQATPSAVRVELDADLDHSDGVLPADELLERRQLLAALKAALPKLPARDREVVERHFLDEQPLRVIAERLGVTESRVCQIAGAAVARLRTHMIGA